MTDIQARAYQAEDAAAVADLINTVGEAGGGPAGFTAVQLDEAVRNEVKDPGEDTRLLVDAEGQIVAAALVALPSSGGDRLELVGGVHPDRRAAGIGRALLAWQLDRAAVRHREVAPDTPWMAQVAAGVADASAIRLYERLGFSVARYFLAMTAPTTPPPVPTPEAVRITSYAGGRERALYAVHRAAFGDLWGYQDPGYEGWVGFTVGSATFRPELSRVALAGDTIVGYVLVYDSSPEGQVYIGHVGTARSWRRRGVASSLLADALAAAARAGYHEAALDADADNPTGAPGVYARLGFAVVRQIVAYRKPV